MVWHLQWISKGIRHGFFVHAIRRRILLTRLQRWMRQRPTSPT